LVIPYFIDGKNHCQLNPAFFFGKDIKKITVAVFVLILQANIEAFSQPVKSVQHRLETGSMQRTLTLLIWLYN
jgi:hypothetical protein